jgi:hypothetical protein
VPGNLGRGRLIFRPTDIARIFFECVDKSAIENFRRFVAHHSNVKKWIVAADFSLGKKRPLGCFAFTIIPYDAWPWELEKDVVANLAKDLKDSKSVPENAIAWLRDNQRFHIAITVTPDRSVFAGGSSKLAQAKGHAEAALVEAEGNQDKVDGADLARLRRLKQLSQSKGFNVRLLGDIWLLGVMFASITALIDRERKSEVIGWFPDRDDMTNWCEGIWHYYAFWNSRRFADDFDVDMRSTQLIVALPDREGGGEIMWFDYLLRAADWFAGAVAEWDRKTGFDSAKHPKYREMWEQVIAGARNVVVLHLDIGSDGAQFRRIEAQRIEPPEKE